MRSLPLRLYHRLPPPLRSVAASLRGAYLCAWRYGPETDALVAEALERDGWSADRWRGYQEERLARLLHRAATRVPYYRDAWARRRRAGDTASWERLENWPLLEKESLRAAPSAFVADDCDPRRMYHDHTSGTTGTPLHLWASRDTVRRWYALFEARARRWYGVSRHDRWGILGGQLVTPVTQRKPPFWVWNAALHQLYLSSYHLAEDTAPAYLDAIRRYRLAYLLVYPSAAAALARDAAALGARDLGLRVVVTNAEPLDPGQRAAIEQAFGCPVRETYGLAEIVAAASECAKGRLHLWPEVGIVELVDGEIVATGLLNENMPLIRYRTGDRATLGSVNLPCDCGRSLPWLEAVEGRLDDVLFTRDGRRIGRLDPIFKARLPIREAQIIQESLDRVRVRVVPARDYAPGTARTLAALVRDRLGHVEVVVEEIERLPRGPNGKLRAVVCALPDDVKARLEGRR